MNSASSRIDFSFPSGVLSGLVTVSFTAYQGANLIHSQSIYPTVTADGTEGSGGGGGIGGISEFSDGTGDYQGTMTELTNTTLPPAQSHYGTGDGKICVFPSNTVISLSNYLVLGTIVVRNSTTYQKTIMGDVEVASGTPEDFIMVFGAGYSSDIGGNSGVVYDNINSPWNAGELTFKTEGGFYIENNVKKLEAILTVYFGSETSAPICSYQFSGSML